MTPSTRSSVFPSSRHTARCAAVAIFSFRPTARSALSLIARGSTSRRTPNTPAYSIPHVQMRRRICAGSAGALGRAACRLPGGRALQRCAAVHDVKTQARLGRAACWRLQLWRGPPYTLLWAWRACRDLLGHYLGLCEQQQVVAPASLGVGARHIEAPERMHTHESAGALAVSVQIADMELALCALDAGPIRGEERAGKSVCCPVGNGQRMVEVTRLDAREDRPEDLLLGNARVSRHLAENGWGDEVPRALK